MYYGLLSWSIHGHCDGVFRFCFGSGRDGAWTNEAFACFFFVAMQEGDAHTHEFPR